MIKPWRKVASKTVVRNRIFTLEARTAESAATRRTHEFFVLDARDWVNVIPVMPDGRIVLVRQYRHGSQEITLEIPGGVIEDGQTPAQAAGRELEEETGYVAESLEYLGRVRPNPAILDNWCYTYLAHNVAETGVMEPDDTEEIEVVLAAPDRVAEMMKSGEIDHALVLAAFLHLWTRPGRDTDKPSFAQTVY